MRRHHRADPRRQPAPAAPGESLAGGQLILRRVPRADGRATVCLAGEVDVNVAAELADALVRSARDVPAGVEVDLSEVAFMDCTGLAALIRAQKRIRQAGQSLTFRTETAVPRVARLLALTHTRRLLSGDRKPDAKVS